MTDKVLHDCSTNLEQLVVVKHSERPLTDDEIKELRELLEANRRMKWLWGNSRKTFIWLAAIIGTVSVAWEALVKFVLYITGK